MVWNPFVTCICPTANRQALIGVAIQSFLSQTYTNSEMLIVDDGEKDTPVPDNPRIRYVRLPYESKYNSFTQDERVAHNARKRNLICELAKGEVIVQFDDDDWSYPTRVENQIKRLRETGKKVTGYNSLSYWDVNETRTFQLYNAGFATGTSLCYYKSYWKEHPFDHMEDVNFSKVAQAAGVLDCVDGMDMIVVRRHTGNTWNSGGRKIDTNTEQFRSCGIGDLPVGFFVAIGVVSPRVSIAMTTYNRPYQLRTTLESIKAQRYPSYEIVVVDDGDDAETPALCGSFGTKYVRVGRPQSPIYRNPARPTNIAIRKSVGDIIILQNAECRHIDPQTIEKLVGRVTDKNVVFARVTSLTQDGRPNPDYPIYCGRENPRPLFFCGAMERAIFERLRGFDEDYVSVCYEDSDFADRLKKEGIEFVFTDIEVHHQWHPYLGVFDQIPSANLFTQKSADMARGVIGTVRNLNREWGVVGPSELQPVKASTSKVAPLVASVVPKSSERVIQAKPGYIGGVKYAADGLTTNWWDSHPR